MKLFRPKNAKKQGEETARGSSSTAEDDESDAKILEKLSNIESRMKDGFSKIDDKIGALKHELKSEIQALKLELSEATKSLNAVWDEVQSLKQKNKVLQEQCDSTVKENGKLIEEVKTLKTRLIQQEDYSRRENLRFYNIPENRAACCTIQNPSTTVVLILVESSLMPFCLKSTCIVKF